MTTVYVLVFIECYEDHSVAGVYATEAAARAVVDAVNAKRASWKLKERDVEAIGSINGPQIIARWGDGAGDGAYIERHALLT